MNHINNHFPLIEIGGLRNLAMQMQDEQLLLMLVQVLRRFKQTMIRVDEITDFILHKIREQANGDSRLHEEISFSLLECHLFRYALMENKSRDLLSKYLHTIIEQLTILEDVQQVYQMLGSLDEKLKQSGRRNMELIKPQTPIQKKQKIISMNLNISTQHQVEKLYKKNQQFLSALGLKIDNKKSTTGCQTDPVEGFQQLRTPKQQRKTEQRVDSLDALYQYNEQQAQCLQYLPSFETEERLTQDIEQFANEIEQYNKKNKPNFERLIVDISNIVLQIFPGSILDVYGSYATELCLPHSDIDLVLKIPNSQNMFLPDLLRNLDTVLKDCKFIEETKCITQSTTPVLRLKCSKMYVNKRLDISILENKHNGIQCVQLIKRYITMYPPLKPLALILKQFLSCSDIADTYSGGLSSYGLVLMIVSFLQSYQEKNWPTLGLLLIEFLHIYGCELDYAGKTIYPSQPNEHTEIPIFFDPENFVYCSQQSLVIIDPVNKANNVGRPTYNVGKLKLAFTLAFVKLLTCESVVMHPLQLFFSCSQNIQSSLHSVLINQYKAYSEQVMFGNSAHY